MRFIALCAGVLLASTAAYADSRGIFHPDDMQTARADIRANKADRAKAEAVDPTKNGNRKLSGVGDAQETRSSEQRLQDCLQRAHSHYHNAWVDACFSKPGGSSNGTDCKLPARLADRLENNLNTERNFCFQKSAAGLL
jgi:hypothetical protein